MGLKSILHTLVDHIDEGHGVDKAALHQEITDLVTEIERGRADDTVPQLPAAGAPAQTASEGGDVSSSLPGETSSEAVDSTTAGGDDSPGTGAEGA